MVRDEAPAATTGRVNERKFDRAEIGSADSRPGFQERSDQLRCCGVHLGREPAGISADWPHCNIQVACHADSKNKSMSDQTVAGSSWNPLATAAANFGQPA
jgi:hypothetical protein